MHPDIEARQLEALQAHARRLGHILTPFYFETYHPLVDAAQVACCRSCGHRVVWGGIARDSGPLVHPCKPNPARALESKSWLTGRVPNLLLERLTIAVEGLAPDVRRSFDPGDFDAENLSLSSDDGVWRLDWYLRFDPDLPVAADNPQNPGGDVGLTRLVPADEIRAARYTGPRHNPNIGNDPAYYIWQLLETNTRGGAYQDGESQWRIRPLNATFAYHVNPSDLVFEPNPVPVDASSASDSSRPLLPCEESAPTSSLIPSDWEGLQSWSPEGQTYPSRSVVQGHRS